MVLTCSYDHAGRWHSFAQRACHPLDAATLRTPTEDTSEILDYLTDDMFWPYPARRSNGLLRQVLS